MTVTKWPTEALCVGRTDLVEAADAELQHHRRSRPHAQELLALCDQCPSRERCLAEAQSDDAKWGAYSIRGGLTPDQRGGSISERFCRECGSLISRIGKNPANYRKRRYCGSACFQTARRTKKDIPA